jgi:hypothetical protein
MWIFRLRAQVIVRVILRRRPALELIVPDVETGRRIRRALRLDVAQVVASFRTGSAFFVRVGAVLAVVPIAAALGLVLLFRFHAASRAHLAAFVAVLGVDMLVIAVSVMLPLLATLEVRADQLTIRSFGRVSTIPMTEVKSASMYEDPTWRRPRLVGLELVLKGGKVVRIPVGNEASFASRVGAMAERVNAAMEVCRIGG